MPHQTIPLIKESARERIRAPLERAWTLPPEAYTSSRIFEAEREAIFGRDWVCVARVDQLPEIGDYLCVDLLDQPLIVARGRDEVLRAFSRVCLHRAMPLAEGSGNATRLVCPYHNWTYELDGRLRSAPMMAGAEGFEPADCRLPELRLETWQGFVFVNRNPEAETLAPQLEGLRGLIENYEFERMVVADTMEFDSPWNWKILVENFMEAYHHIGTHRTTLQPDYPAGDSVVENNGGGPWALLRMPSKGSADNQGLPVFRKLTELQRGELVAICVYPTLLFAASATGAAWYQLEPTAHDRMRLRIHVLAAPEVRDTLDPATRAALADRIRVIHEEDIHANEGPWRGLQAGLTTQGRLSPFEKSIWQLNQLWAHRLALP